MKSKNKVIWGIILILAAVALILLAVFPEFSFGSISVWKIIVGILLIYWGVSEIIDGNGADKLDALIPLAVILTVFENNIASLLGKDQVFSGWKLIVAAILIVIGVRTLTDGFKIGKKHAHTSKLGANTVYLDATQKTHTVNAKISATEVFFSNTDMVNADDEITLNLNGNASAIEIHVPENWYVDAKFVSDKSATEIRPNPEVWSAKLVITGRVKMSAVEVK